jgi:hypothetical protein
VDFLFDVKTQVRQYVSEVMHEWLQFIFFSLERKKMALYMLIVPSHAHKQAWNLLD